MVLVWVLAPVLELVLAPVLVPGRVLGLAQNRLLPRCLK
jgi:hypothetical protein